MDLGDIGHGRGLHCLWKSEFASSLGEEFKPFNIRQQSLYIIFRPWYPCLSEAISFMVDLCELDIQTRRGRSVSKADLRQVCCALSLNGERMIRSAVLSAKSVAKSWQFPREITKDKPIISQATISSILTTYNIHTMPKPALIFSPIQSLDLFHHQHSSLLHQK